MLHSLLQIPKVLPELVRHSDHELWDQCISPTSAIWNRRLARIHNVQTSLRLTSASSRQTKTRALLLDSPIRELPWRVPPTSRSTARSASDSRRRRFPSSSDQSMQAYESLHDDVSHGLPRSPNIPDLQVSGAHVIGSHNAECKHRKISLRPTEGRPSRRSHRL